MAGGGAPYEEGSCCISIRRPGLLSVPVWLSAAVAAVLVVLAILAIARSGIVKTMFALVVLAVVGYGGWMGWQVFERTAASERVEERRAFDRRVAELTGRTTAPGSPLSCLDGAAIEPLTAGCEKILFGSPENVTAAVSYVTARHRACSTDGLESCVAVGPEFRQRAEYAARRGWRRIVLASSRM